MSVVAVVALAAVVFLASIVGYAVAPLIWMVAAWLLEWTLERMGR